jgi:hypothetical protein
MSKPSLDKPQPPKTYNLPLVDFSNPAGPVPTAHGKQPHLADELDSYEEPVEHPADGPSLGSLLLRPPPLADRVDVRSRVAGMLEKERDL